jgi:hypothetical protein
MSTISIEIDDKEIRAWGSRWPNRLDAAIRGTLEDGSTLMLGEITRYPPPPTGSRYVRTNTLFRSWSRKPITKETWGWRVVIGSSGNIAPYNRWVQDRDRQAAQHRGRWRTAQDIIEAAEVPIQRFANARIRVALEGT